MRGDDQRRDRSARARRLRLLVAPVALCVLTCALPAPRAAADDRNSTEPRTPPGAAPTPRIDPVEWLTHAARLAGEPLRGRESGTLAGDAAEQLVAQEFERIGLSPLVRVNDSEGATVTAKWRLYQHDVVLPMRPMKPADTQLFGASSPLEPLGTDADVMPFSFSANGDVAAPVVFCGYGLVDPENDWDDYAGVDVRGKIVVALRHGPRELDPSSPWTMKGRVAPAQRMKLAFRTKAMNAAERGAAALILVNDRHHGDEPLPVRVPGEPVPLPFVAASRAVVDTLLAPSQRTLDALQRGLDDALKPASFAVPCGTVRLVAYLGERRASNVVGLLPGNDPAVRDECVLLGAHVDHVGLGRFGSSQGEKARGKIHNGADDNASGTAALLEIAAYMAAEAKAGRPPRRTVLFVGWCGEEMGLVGSREWVRKAGLAARAHDRVRERRHDRGATAASRRATGVCSSAARARDPVSASSSSPPLRRTRCESPTPATAGSAATTSRSTRRASRHCSSRPGCTRSTTRRTTTGGC